MSRRVLVVAAHPDDEILGCAGTIARHVDLGDTVDVLIVAEGATSRGAARNASADANALAELRAAAAAAAEVLGTNAPVFGGFPDNRLDSVPLLDVVKLVESQSKAVSPEIVYTHNAGDLNIDHQVVARAVATAFRPLPDSDVHAIYAFETVSSTEWALPMDAGPYPVRFVDIAAQLDRKQAALDCYEVEMREFPHARSKETVEALARVRGASAGLIAAEAFWVVREIDR